MNKCFGNYYFQCIEQYYFNIINLLIMIVPTLRNSFRFKKILCVTIIIIVALVMMRFKTNIYQKDIQELFFTRKGEQVSRKSNLKYILLWTLPTRDPVKYLGRGQNAFINKNCSIINCYVTGDRHFFNDVTLFDVIIFHSSDIDTTDLPKLRSAHQKYVFASMESSDYYPSKNGILNNFFNWTWTYKINSDVQYGYMSIKNSNGVIIGPKELMHWKNIEDMEPIDEVLKTKLSTKRYAAAWFVSNCQSHSKRERIALELIYAMRKHDLILDIYGSCGSKKCPLSSMSACLELLERDYYFYLSFENSFSKDYVTEKLLHALQHYTIPIVFGGANYTRFMPDGIYLDAKNMTATQLAAKMAELINNEEEYYSYFKWHKYYSYHRAEESPVSDPYCKLCSMINQRFKEISTYEDFSMWWNT